MSIGYDAIIGIAWLPRKRRYPHSKKMGTNFHRGVEPGGRDRFMEQLLIINDIPWNLNKVITAASRHWAVYAKEKSRWEILIRRLVKSQGLKHCDAPVKIVVRNVYPEKRRRDADNIILKFILDGLVSARILDDDDFEHVTSISILPPIVMKGKRQTLIKLQC